jgi:predicted DCC family thiol-disulfide oxidoreductase YuxK
MNARWRAQPAADLPDLIVFDGDCVFCSRWAHWVHQRDPSGRFKFVAIQSPLGRLFAERFGIDAEPPQTNLAVIDGEAQFKSDASLAILATARGWRWVKVLAAMPSPIRNWLYDVVARNRYRLFGRREACWANDPVLKARVVNTLDEL